MNEEKLREQLRQMDANIQVTHLLLTDLLAELPQAEVVLRRLQESVERMVKTAPNHVDQEYLVELRARAAQTANIVRMAQPSSSGRQPTPG